MGRKSRKSCMIKPFCYFCCREFDNEKILIQHQKAKHFKCSECNRKLETANGLLVHMQQVHKMVQRRVPNSLEGRDNISSTIQGMNGVPAEVIEEHRLQHLQRLTNLKRQKQQRISWTQINAPGFSSQAVTLTNNFSSAPGTHPSFAAPSYSNFSNGAPASANMGGLASNSMSNGMGGFTDTPAAVPMASDRVGPFAGSTPSSGSFDGDSKNKLLILDANGMPLSQPASSFQRAVQPPLRQPLSIQSNKILYKSNFSQPSSTPVLSSDSLGFTSSQSTRFDRPAPASSTPIASSSNMPRLDRDVDPRLIENLEDSTFHTTFYKATGVQPLYVPPPTLGTTKLSYSSDTVSIEELRAKIKFNWHDGQP